jgi:hypothetical protein
MDDSRLFYKTGNLGFPETQTIETETIKDGTFVKKIVDTVLVDHNTKGRRIESICISEFKKNKKADQWPSVPINKITLDNASLVNLVNYLELHKEFLKFDSSTTYRLLTGVEQLSELNTIELDSLVQLVKKAAKQDKLKDMVQPDVINNFSAAIQQARYKSAMLEIETMILNTTLSEASYNKWFIDHHWVFGTEYLGTEDGKKIGWASKADIVLRSVDGYQDFIELKLPSAEVLKWDSSHSNWYPSVELSKAIAQVIKYFQETADARMLLAEKEGLAFLKPRARIVIGRHVGWDQAQFDALRRLNSSLQNIQIMTFDHLLQSAGQMVKYYET